MITCKIRLRGEREPIELELQEHLYGNGTRALVAYDTADRSQRFGVLTSNVDLAISQLAPNEILVKDYSENAAWVPQVLAELPQIFEPTGRLVDSGYVQMSVYRYRPEFQPVAQLAARSEPAVPDSTKPTPT